MSQSNFVIAGLLFKMDEEEDGYLPFPPLVSTDQCPTKPWSPIGRPVLAHPLIGAASGLLVSGNHL